MKLINEKILNVIQNDIQSLKVKSNNEIILNKE